MDTFIEVGLKRFLIRTNGTVYELCMCSTTCRCIPELLDSRAGRLAKEVARLNDVIERMKKEREADAGVVTKPTTCEASLSKLGLPLDPPFQYPVATREGFEIPAFMRSGFNVQGTEQGPLPEGPGCSEDTGHP